MVRIMRGRLPGAEGGLNVGDGVTGSGGMQGDIDVLGLSIRVLGRQYPEAQDYSDGNWLCCAVEMQAPGATIRVEGSIVRCDEVARFLVGLEAMHHDLAGKAELECTEPNLALTLAFVGQLGQIEGSVDITPDHRTQVHRFKIGGNQSHLPGMIAGCRRVLAQHPVLGVPD